MKCLECGKDVPQVKGKRAKQYCNDVCKQVAYRNRQTVTDDNVTQTVTSDVIPYEIVEGEQVYHRQAVAYNLDEAWPTRPIPDGLNDIPLLNNRGVYIRPDETAYQIDAVGIAHNIDVEDKERVKALLDSWVAGRGTPYQQRLATLGKQYSAIKGQPIPEI